MDYLVGGCSGSALTVIFFAVTVFIPAYLEGYREEMQRRGHLRHASKGDHE